MNLPFIGDIIDGVGKIADELHTSEEERLSIELKDKIVDASIIHDQIEVHAEEVQHPSIFVAGARLAVIWVAAGGLAYNLILHPIIEWLFVLLQAFEVIPYSLCVVQVAGDPCSMVQITPPPKADSTQLMALVTGGGIFGAYRSYDKLNGTETKSIS